MRDKWNNTLCKARGLEYFKHCWNSLEPLWFKVYKVLAWHFFSPLTLSFTKASQSVLLPFALMWVICKSDYFPSSQIHIHKLQPFISIYLSYSHAFPNCHLTAQNFSHFSLLPLSSPVHPSSLSHVFLPSCFDFSYKGLLPPAWAIDKVS